MVGSLENYGIIVFGGSSGAGEAAVDHYLECGAKVLSLDVQPGPKDDGRAVESFRALRCDISVQAEVDQAVDGGVGFLGSLDAICVPAGITARARADEITQDEMRRIFEINMLGTMFANQAAFRHMRENGGSIINFTSISAIRGQKLRAHYSATKGAIAAWTRAAAIDWAPFSIRVNSVAPMIYTPIVDKVRAKLPPDQIEAWEKTIGAAQLLPGGLRPASAIGPLLEFLASKGSSYITGQSFSIDGGAMMLGS